MKTSYFLAFDLGATSGRTILGTIRDGKLEMEELTRFPNVIIRVLGRYHWDIYALYEALKAGLAVAAKRNIKIDAVGVDTWGVDFVFVGKDGSLMGLPRAYRDPYTDDAMEKYFQVVPKKEVYEKTGIQFMQFNSLFQLFAQANEKSAALEAAECLLFIPDALTYLLSGQKVCEYTILSTSQFLDPRTKMVDEKLLKAAGVNPGIIPPVTMPGTVVGRLLKEVAEETGMEQVPVVAVAGHDTGAAVAAVPATDEKFAYLSSGTWSLMGIEVKEPIINEKSFGMNFTNEGGVDGTTRFLKNITGMWLLEQCRKEWEKEGKSYTYPQIVEMAHQATPFVSMVNPDDPMFANPVSMLGAIEKFCERTGQPVPGDDKAVVRCIFESLALRYRQVLGMLREVAPFPIEKFHVIGGGAQNKLLNQFTADSIGIPVVAGPSEATAIGNIMMQAKAVGLVENLAQMRAVIRDSVSPDIFTPSGDKAWDQAFEKFQKIQ